MQELADTFTNILENRYILTGDAISARATSYWDPRPMRGPVLLLPGNTEDISAILKVCNEAAQPVVVIGGNTGGAQGQHPQGNEVIISMERMNHIKNIDVLNATATVEAGCTLEALQHAVAEKDLICPLDLGARGSCTIGGNISSNAGGINVIRYGMMRNITLGLEAVLPDGRVITSMNRMIKNNTGYDLKQLFIGSEGTLGVVTRAVIKLEEAPLSVNTAMLGLGSFDKVVQTLRHLRRNLGNVLTAYEYMDRDYYQAVTGPDANRAPLPPDHECYVVVESRGTHQQNDELIFQQSLLEASNQGLVDDILIASSERERRDFWKVRENFEPILRHHPYFLYDVSLPIGAMQEYLDEVRQGVKQLWPDGICTTLAHVGDNNLHFFIAPRCKDIDGREKASAIVYGPLTRLEGSVSAEHGIGLEKKSYLGLTRSENEIDLMRLLKRTLDPNNILSPGRIFEL